VGDEILGKKIRCKGCQAVFVAAAAKVKVGAAAAERANPSTPRGTNGVKLDDHQPSKRSAAKPSGGLSPALLIGGGLALLGMIGITLWALFLRDTGNTSDTQASNNTSSNVTRIALHDKPPEKSADEPKREQPKVETAKTPEKPVFGPATFVKSPGVMPFTIKPEVSSRVTRSAAWIKVAHPQGGGFGSGWFAEPGIVITNAHVVGMKEPAAPPPTGIKIVIHPGKPGEERELEGELLGLDRENDLAVIRVQGENLPDPMPIARSSEMAEGQKLYVCGFPLGNQIARMYDDDKVKVVTTVKLRESAVTGRLPTKHGSVKWVQIEGGADPGNSGGMIVDPAGNVRCVLVAGIPGSNLRFSIPSEYPVYLLQGRILRVVPRQAYQAGEQVKQPWVAFVADPMKRIKKVSLELWTGEPGKRVRGASETPPTPAVGDSSRTIIDLAYNPDEKVPLGESREACGECDLPPLPTGHVYWVQPHYVGVDGKDRWGEAVALEIVGLPVQRKAAKLSIVHQPNTERTVDLESHLAIGATPEGGELHLRDSGIVVKLTEKTNAVQPDGSAKVTIKYKDLKFTDEDTDNFYRTNIRGALEAAAGMVTDMVVTKRGLIKNAKPVLDKVPTLIRPFVTQFNVQTVQSLEALSLALPDREVQPGESWQFDQNYSVRISRLTENALFKLNFRFIGTRIRDGREEAVIEFDGDIVRGEGNEYSTDPEPAAEKGKGKSKGQTIRVRNLYGKARGAALVDLSTGLVTVARTRADMEFEVPFTGQGNIKFGGAYLVELFRHVAPDAKKPNFNQLLPNQEVVLYPFVGAPDNANVSRAVDAEPEKRLAYADRR
jgi:S1-C subfamily serine protease